MSVSLPSETRSKAPADGIAISVIEKSVVCIEISHDVYWCSLSQELKEVWLWCVNRSMQCAYFHFHKFWDVLFYDNERGVISFVCVNVVGIYSKWAWLKELNVQAALLHSLCLLADTNAEIMLFGCVVSAIHYLFKLVWFLFSKNDSINSVL